MKLEVAYNNNLVEPFKGSTLIVIMHLTFYTGYSKIKSRWDLVIKINFINFLSRGYVIIRNNFYKLRIFNLKS